MSTTIDARVKQKTGTAADFAGYQLLAGEIALVRTSANGPVWNFKVGPGNFDSLDWSLQNPGAAQEADTSTVFPAGVPGLYIPTESGTYDGVPVDLSAGYTQLIWDGANLVDAVFPIDLAGYVAKTDLAPTINPSGTDAPTEKAVADYVQPVDDKISAVVNDETDSQTHVDVANGGGYALASNIGGWGFPIMARNHISKIGVAIYSNSGSTQQRVIVRETDKNGAVLADKSFSIAIPGDSTRRVIDFEFDAPIINTNDASLWVEVYSDSSIAIFRTNPAQVFTQAEGYPFVLYTLAKDLGATQVSAGTAGSSYYDVYHEVTTEETTVSDFTDWAKTKIADESIAANQPTTNKAEWAVESENQVVVDKSGGATFGSNFNYYGWGWAGKAHTDIAGIIIKLGIREDVTSYRLIVRETDLSGAILSDETKSVNIPIQNPYELTHVFAAPIANTNNTTLYYELYTNGGVFMFRTNPATVFTDAAGYPKMANASQVGDMGATPVAITGASVWADIDHSIILQGENYSFTPQAISDIESKIKVEGTWNLPNENQRISFTGSSVTWGDGYLQSGYVAEYIKWLQSGVARAVLPSDVSGGTLLSNRQHFLGQARRLQGTGAEISFSIKGNEVSIVQGIDRSNTAASEIEIYIDGALHDTFNNFNPAEIGSDSTTFEGDGEAVMFDLGRAFTYDHAVTLNGSPQVVTHNITQGTGFSIPGGSDCAIIRRLGQDSNVNPAVTHWLWFKTAPGVGDDIGISYSYGEAMFYERTTIGQDAAGNNESPYGDGDTSFDPLAPSAVATGLDFRQTDERVVKTYRFVEEKTRTVRLRIKGLYPGASGTPYFIFNFATNRYFHFQNAGIGGWDLWDLDRTLSQDYLRGWQRVIQFNPDKLVIETTPNDDWIVKGHRIYEVKNNISLTELRAIKNLPLRHIQYNAGTDDYNISRWRGTITAITVDSVTFTATVDTPVVAGDVVMIGQYWANNKDYIERIISNVVGDTVYFDQPISDSECIYGSIQEFVGKEIGIRTLETFTAKLDSIIDKIRATTDCPIYVLENPMPNVLGRELWGYPIIMKMISNSKTGVNTIDYNSLREWQESQPKTSVNINAASATTDLYLDFPVVEFGSNGQNLLAVDVLLDGVSIYGTRAVVQNGWAYTVNQSATGAALNRNALNQVNSGQVFNGRRPRLVILDDTLTSGTLVVQYASVLWSNDSCHMTVNSSKLYADFLSQI